MYFQCQQYLLGVTFSKNSSNIFLVCTEGLCLCIYRGMDCLPYLIMFPIEIKLMLGHGHTPDTFCYLRRCTKPGVD